MLNKLNLAVAQFASTEESRYTLQAIQVTPDATVATDGHRLMWVSTDSVESENFPVVAGMPGTMTDSFAPFLLAREAALRIAKVTPTKEKIPVLNHVAVAQTESDGETSRALAVTDLENPQVFPVKSVTGTFPSYEAVIPRFEDAKFRICLNASYLAEIAKFAMQFDDARRNFPVLLSFYSADGPMRFDATKDGQGMTAVCMPMRGIEDRVGTYGFADRQKAKREHEEMIERVWAEAIAEDEARADFEREYLSAWSEALMENAARKQPALYPEAA